MSGERHPEPTFHVDTESSTERSWTDGLGLRGKSFMLLRRRNDAVSRLAEVAEIDAMQRKIRDGDVKLIILDSVAEIG